MFTRKITRVSIDDTVTNYYDFGNIYDPTYTEKC